MATYGQGGILKSTRGPVKIDGGADGDQLAPPPELTELDPDPYGEADKPVDIAALVEGDDEPERPEPIAGDVVTVVDEKGARIADLRAQLAQAEADAEPDPSTTVALVDRFDVTKGDEVWPYDELEFEGDLLGVRLPTKQALAGFSLASSKYVSLGVKNDLTGLFIARHLSPESYGRVFSRLMDPDDDAYGVETVGELFNAIVTASIEADKEP